MKAFGTLKPRFLTCNPVVLSLTLQIHTQEIFIVLPGTVVRRLNPFFCAVSVTTLFLLLDHITVTRFKIFIRRRKMMWVLMPVVHFSCSPFHHSDTGSLYITEASLHCIAIQGVSGKRVGSIMQVYERFPKVFLISFCLRQGVHEHMRCS